jgi:hypothetical protein
MQVVLNITFSVGKQVGLNHPMRPQRSGIIAGGYPIRELTGELPDGS